jgi:hypothetical protein
MGAVSIIPLSNHRGFAIGAAGRMACGRGDDHELRDYRTGIGGCRARYSGSSPLGTSTGCAISPMPPSRAFWFAMEKPSSPSTQASLRWPVCPPPISLARGSRAAFRTRSHASGCCRARASRSKPACVIVTDRRLPSNSSCGRSFSPAGRTTSSRFAICRHVKRPSSISTISHITML